jgi:RimJ/RimL family protein N-acetyltransferase
MMLARIYSVKDGVLYGADEAVARLVKRLSGVNKGDWPWFRALGVVKGDTLVGGVVFHNYRPEAYDIEITAGFSTPRWCSPATLTQILRYPITQLGCRRCTARTAMSNRKARFFLERLGFECEGVMRRAYDGKEDMLVYGVLREQLAWQRV